MSNDVHWKDVRLALGASLAVTCLLGAGLFIAFGNNVWGIALAGLVGLLLGGGLIGKRAGRGDAGSTFSVLAATLLTVFYFGVTVVVIIGGTLTELVPEPLPGLPIGDSTFFFVWPLTQLAAAVIGALVGGSSRLAFRR